MRINIAAPQIKDLIEKSNKVLLLTRANPSVDGVCSMIALNDILASLGKNPTAATTGRVPEEVNHLPHISRLMDRIEPKNLIISFDYVEGMIDKVSYKIEGNKFKLIISPKEKRINPEQVEYSYKGTDYDLVFILDSPDLESLGKLFADPEFYSTATTVNIDRRVNNTQFGKVNIIEPRNDSVCAIITKLLADSNIKLTSVAADALLFGLRASTSNFTKVNNPSTFEAASICVASSGRFGTQSEMKIANEESIKTSEKNFFAPKIFKSSSSD